MRNTGEHVKPKAFINLPNRCIPEQNRATLSKDTITRREENYSNKKVEELKIMYKKLTVKALIFNLERGNYDEVQRDLKRLHSAAKASSSFTELILNDLYLSINDFRKGNLKQFLVNVNRCLSKIDKNDFNHEMYFDENDKMLFEKFIFNTCLSLLKEIFSKESSFRSIIPETFKSYDGFISNLVSKDHFSSFVYFFAILCLTKNNLVKLRDQYIKSFKEKTSFSLNSTIENRMNSISTLYETDLFYVSMKDVINRIESNLIINETPETKFSSKQSRKKILNTIEVFSMYNSSSPATRRKMDKSNEKKKKSTTNISNYHKYIKNLKNIRNKEVFTPIPNKDEKVKSRKNSLEKRLSKSNSDKSKKIEKDETRSTNYFSVNNHLNITNVNNLNIIQTSLCQFNNLSKVDDMNVNDTHQSENMLMIIDKIDSKLNDMNSEIVSFSLHIQDLRNFLSEC